MRRAERGPSSISISSGCASNLPRDADGGGREQEAIYLTWPRINFERGYARIRANAEYDFKVKDKEQRDIILPPDFTVHIRMSSEAPTQ